MTVFHADLSRRPMHSFEQAIKNRRVRLHHVPLGLLIKIKIKGYNYKWIGSRGTMATSLKCWIYRYCILHYKNIAKENPKETLGL